MALHHTEWIFLSFVFVFCLVQSTQGWNGGKCGRYACGRKRELVDAKRMELLENKSKGAMVVGKADKKVFETNKIISVRKPCWRFGCGKRYLIRVPPNGNDIQDSRLHPSKHHLHETEPPKHESIERESRCSRFGCMKSIDQGVAQNLRHKKEFSQMEDSSKMRCSRFGCFVKKSVERVLLDENRKFHKDLKKRLSNLIFDKRDFQENDGTKLPIHRMNNN